MDLQLVNKKHFDLYLDTLEVGVGVSYITERKTLYFKILILEAVVYLGKDGKF